MDFKTERLYIRPVSISDKESIFAYRSDPETYKYLSLIPKTVDEVEDFIKKSSSLLNVPGSWFQFVIIEQLHNKVIGDIGIHFLDTSPENKQVEIGYTLDRNYRGKGYATEALTVVVNYLITGLNKHRITASIDPTNKSSIQLIERLGFRKEAHFIESLYFHGMWVDDLIYAILAKEWRKK
ncbi:MAG: GNAT family N-acetyltransferase [Daejeonella sp.]|uniref:GNAT family N-acetyltransferase n=1 Tax=Daejeonella sp. TaxID=2805397 RepID=UPI0027348A82|nr:GNAT family N-acetyltransferase [Daejeonella sp.]MDP3468836.1 GNAT family N-acetyltransferase [Daejeonella sp.]